jgi:hypothetical protein
MKTKVILLSLLAALGIAGCQQETVNIDIANDNAKALMALDYRDFGQVASEMVQSMVSSGSLQKEGGGRYVVTTGRIINDTMQRIDTDQLMAKIEEELFASGKIVMTSAVGGEGASDKMIYRVRELRESEHADEFNQKTVAAKGQLIAPELSISGKILQRNLHYDSKTQQVEYYFQLKVTDLTTGLRFWQKETILGKRGSNKSVAW